MAYNVRPHRVFERSVAKLPQQLRERIFEKIDMLAAHPEIIGTPMKHLPVDLKGLHKDRVGDWRIFYWVDHAKKEIVPYDVDRRDIAYKRLRT